MFPVNAGAPSELVRSGASRVVALPDGGGVMVGGEASGHGFDAAELTAGGSLDPSFGNRGVAHVTVDSPPAVPLQILRQPDGKLVVIVSGRRTTAFVLGQLLVVRLDADGRLDRTFGSHGIALAPLAPACGSCTVAALAPDGDIVLTGEGGVLSAALGGDPGAGLEWDVTRLNADGAVDPNFGQGGIDRVSTDDAVGLDVAALADGEVMTLGETAAAPTAMLSLRAPNGGADREFNGGAPAALPPGSGASAMLVETDRSVVVGGITALYRYTPVGLPDPSFGHDGVADIGGLPRPLQLFPAPGGEILAVGRPTGVTTTLRAVRFAADGAVDSTLGGPTGIRFRAGFGGGRSSPPASARSQPVPPLAQDSFAVHAVAVRPDGSYLAVGGVDVTEPTGTATGRSIFDFAAAAIAPDFTPLAGFGAPADRVRVKLSFVPESAATAASRHGIAVRVDVSATGLTLVTIKSGGHVIADGVTAILEPGPHTTTIGLTRYGASRIRKRGGLHVTGSATARDLVLQGARASSAATLSSG